MGSLPSVPFTIFLFHVKGDVYLGFLFGNFSASSPVFLPGHAFAAALHQSPVGSQASKASLES